MLLEDKKVVPFHWYWYQTDLLYCSIAEESIVLSKKSDLIKAACNGVCISNYQVSCKVQVDLTKHMVLNLDQQLQVDL